MLKRNIQLLITFRASIASRTRPWPPRVRMASTFPNLPIFRAIAAHDPHSTAIIHSKSNRRFTYGELLKDVEDAKVKLYTQMKSTDVDSIGGQRVAFLVENGYDYVGAKYAISFIRKTLR